MHNHSGPLPLAALNLGTPKATNAGLVKLQGRLISTKQEKKYICLPMKCRIVDDLIPYNE